MERVVPWSALVEPIAPYYAEGGPAAALRLGDKSARAFHAAGVQPVGPGHGRSLLRHVAVPPVCATRWPDESTSLRLRHRLEKHELAEAILAVVNRLLAERGFLLKAGTPVDATLTRRPAQPRTKTGSATPDLHSSKKANQGHFGMKAHIGADADSGLVNTVRGILGHVDDVTEGDSLPHEKEVDAFRNAGYQGIAKRGDAKGSVCHMR